MGVSDPKFSPAAFPNILLLPQDAIVPPLKNRALPLPVMWQLLRRTTSPVFAWIATELKLTWQFSRSIIAPPETAVSVRMAALLPVALLSERFELLICATPRFVIRKPFPDLVMELPSIEMALAVALVPAIK